MINHIKGIVAVISICTAFLAGAAQESSEKWEPLFNGKDLTGWTPKFRGSPAGENYRNTFRVEDGVLKVSYDQYPKFEGQFGHLFWKEKLSHYRLRVEYRVVGEQSPGAPSWGFRNSGVMIHSESPQSMDLDQDFPTSIEVQLLGGAGTEPRPTANVCTPGTHIVMDGQLITRHCTNSKARTYDGDQWVTVEIEVRGNRLIRHIIDGETVLSYSEPQLDEKDAHARKLLEQGTPRQLSEGYICVQAESHPVEFRKIELLRLPAQGG